jgi:uncharacterized membrane protein YfhO
MGVGYPGSAFFVGIGENIINVLPEETLENKSEQIEDFRNSLKKLDEYLELQNKLYKERVRLIPDGKVIIKEYEANKIQINYEAKEDSKLILSDAWYPGWKAIINGNEVKIIKYQDIFRSVEVPKGKGEIIFNYQPRSFEIGLKISAISGLFWLGLLIYFWKKDKK